MASGRQADTIQDRDAGQQNCLRGLAPPYLNELCRPVVHLTGRRHLRSAASGKLDVQKQPLVAGTLLFPVRRLETVYLPSSCRSWRRGCFSPSWPISRVWYGWPWGTASTFVGDLRRHWRCPHVVPVVSVWSDPVHALWLVTVVHHLPREWCTAGVGAGAGPVRPVYTTDLVSLIESHSLSPHIYADDTQVHGSCSLPQLMHSQ